MSAVLISQYTTTANLSFDESFVKEVTGNVRVKSPPVAFQFSAVASLLSWRVDRKPPVIFNWLRMESILSEASGINYGDS